MVIAVGEYSIAGKIKKSVYGNQGPEKHTNIKEYFPETGFDVLPAVPGRKAVFND